MDMDKVGLQQNELNQRERKARLALAWAAALVCGACFVVASTASAAEKAKPNPSGNRSLKSPGTASQNGKANNVSKSTGLSLPLTLSASAALSSSSTKLAPNGPLIAGEPLLASPGSASTKEAPHSCKNDGAMVCYDYRRGRAVMPLTKSVMPEVPGLRKESITLKRDKLAFNYSF